MQFTLRRISSEGVEMNFALGQSYTVVHRETAHDRFTQDFKNYFAADNVYDGTVYAFVGSEGGQIICPLYDGQQAYVMTESGSTFSNLTLKKDRSIVVTSPEKILQQEKYSGLKNLVLVCEAMEEYAASRKEYPKQDPKMPDKEV